MNKFVVFAAALMLTSGVAFADGQSQTASTQSASQAAASNAGNSQNITFTAPADTTAAVTETVAGTTTNNQNVHYSGTTTQEEEVKNVPNVSTSQLTTSNDTCMGSTVAGGSAVGFGLSFGTTHTDKNCVMLKNARELWNMGMRAAALARLCMDKDNRAALEVTGFTCPQDKAQVKTSK